MLLYTKDGYQVAGLPPLAVHESLSWPGREAEIVLVVGFPTAG